MTGLERAARALAVEYYAPAGSQSDKAFASERWEDFAALARAVLLAIREPGIPAEVAGAAAIQGPVGGSATKAAADCFTAMIDVLLAD